MFRPRIIPCLLLKNLGLVKTIQFKNERYIGDPMNAVRIFNAKEADELIFLDITATHDKRKLDLNLIERIADEAFMPFAVGGGIRSIEDIRLCLSAGAEKVSISSYAIENPDFIRDAADVYGSSTIAVTLDVKKGMFGKYGVYSHNGKKSTGLDPVTYACLMENKGAGEIIINSIDHDGMMNGYDFELIKKIADSLTIPLVALGGAGHLSHLKEAYEKANASAMSAGSLFIYHGPRKAVLINFPTKDELKELFI